LPADRDRRARLGVVLAIAASAALAACGRGSSPITSERIERAVESTFANLVQLQVSRLKITPLAAKDLDVIAACRRRAGGADAGAGEWTCAVRWLAPDRRTLRDTFDVIVTTDACYTAAAEGDQLGGPTLKASDGGEIRNLLYVFEGCFDPT